MAFKIRNKQDIVLNILDELRRTGINYLPNGSKARALTETLSREIDIAYKFFDSNFDQAFLANASNEFLEALGTIFGVSRKNAKKAISPAIEQNLTFYVTGDRTFGEINDDLPIDIPSGTIISVPTITSQQNPIQYQLTSSVSLSPTARVAFCTVEALTEGSFYNVGANSLINHQFTSYSDSINESLKVTNRYAILTGSDREEDSLYRARISLAAQSLQRANLTSLRFALLSVPGIVDIKLFPYFDGIGTVGAFILGADNDISPILVNYAQNALNEFASAGEIVTAYAPNRVGIEFSTFIETSRELTINEENQLERSLRDTVSSYITSLKIGDTLDLIDLSSRLQSVSPLITGIGTNSGTNPFDEFYIYRYSDASGERVRQKLLSNTTEVLIEDHEIIIPETSISDPFTFEFDSI